MLCASLVLGLHLATYHFNREEKYQEINPGVSVACEEWQAGVYYNSYKDVSVYGTRVFRNVYNTGIDVAVGAVLGYSVPVLPLVVPSYKIGDVRISLIPPVNKQTGGIHMSVEF
jgi:hypothetical protein